MKEQRLKLRRFTGMALALAILFFGLPALADELADLQAALKARGARWHAGDNPIARLPKEKRKALVGLIKKHEPEGEELLSAVQEPLTGLPTALDWRNYNGNWVTPVRNQGSCGSCWAFATTGALESYQLRLRNTPGVNLDLSEQVLVSCSGAGSCGGGYIGAASNYIRDTGLPVESCYPYTATNGSCSNACSTVFTGTYDIDSWAYVCTTAPTVIALKNALYTYGPLVTTMDVYSDFYYYKSGVYHYTSGSYQGGHAVVLVGYDDALQAFLAKNSWGTGWGMSGYFWIGYDQLAANSATPQGCEFGYYTIAYQTASPSPPPPTCTYSVSPTSFFISRYGGSGYKISVTASAASGCSSWKPTTSASWITITSPTGYVTGSGTVVFNVARNLTRRNRTATISVAGVNVKVTQSE